MPPFAGFTGSNPVVDELLIGNRGMGTTELISGDGTRIDLRNIRSPILCFCSEGDNITPEIVQGLAGPAKAPLRCVARSKSTTL